MRFIVLILPLLLVGCTSANQGAQEPSSNAGVTQTDRPPEKSSQTTNSVLTPTVVSAPTTVVVAIKDFHQISTEGTKTSTTLMPGKSIRDMATRVAFTVHQVPQWWVTLATDLDPVFAQALATTRNPNTSGDQGDGAVLVLISVDQHPDNPDLWFVSFDVETSDASVGERHVTAIAIDRVSGLVTDVRVLV